jgi:hypothetical protein
MNEKISKEAYYQKIKGIRAKLETDACHRCSCPKTSCEWHGDCYTCVRQHRIHADHLPNCLQPILDAKISAIAQVAEMTVAKKPHTPSDYWDYVRQRDAEEAARQAGAPVEACPAEDHDCSGGHA